MSEPPVEYIELNMSNYNEDDVRQLNEWAIWACEELERLNAELAELQRWKCEAIAVENEWNPQVVGKLLGIPLGTSIRAAVQPRIEKLIAENERLKAQVKHYHDACARQQYDIQGTLAKALGYGGTEEGELPEWGEHIAETLAEEIAAKLAATTQELERLMRHVSEEPNPKTRLPDWAQRLWQSLVHLSDKAEFKHIVKHIETLEKELTELLSRAGAERNEQT